MSTLTVSNVSDGSLTIPTTYVTNGSAKAWICYDQSPTSIYNSLNVSSITDNGAGDHTTNMTTSMSGSKDYSIATAMQVTTTAMVRVGVLVGLADTGGGPGQHFLSGSFRIASAANNYSGGQGVMGDYDTITASIHGDLA